MENQTTFDITKYIRIKDNIDVNEVNAIARELPEGSEQILAYQFKHPVLDKFTELDRLFIALNFYSNWGNIRLWKDEDGDFGLMGIHVHATHGEIIVEEKSSIKELLNCLIEEKTSIADEHSLTFRDFEDFQVWYKERYNIKILQKNETKRYISFYEYKNN